VEFVSDWLMVRCYNKYVSFNKEKNICSPSKIRFDRLRVYNICEREKRERERNNYIYHNQREKDASMSYPVKAPNNH